MKGRQLKEVRKRVQAAIDLKNAGGGGGAVGARLGKGMDTDAQGQASCSTTDNGAVVVGDGVAPEAAGETGGGVAAGEIAGSKRERCKDWRTYRHKKKSAVDQEEEDSWYGKSKSTGREGSASSAADKDETVKNEGVNITPAAVAVSGGGDSEDSARSGVEGVGELNAAESVAVGDSPSDAAVGAAVGDKDVTVVGEGLDHASVDGAREAGKNAVESITVGEDMGETVNDMDDGDEQEECEEEGHGEKGEEGPEKVIILRELRTRYD